MLPSQALQLRRDEIREIMKRYPMLSNLRVCGSVARKLLHDIDVSARRIIAWDTVWNTATHALPELVEAIAPLVGDTGK